MSVSGHQSPGSAADAQDWVESWIAQDALATLVEAFGGLPDRGTTITDQLRLLEEFSARWDFRGGQERNLASAREFDASTEELIVECADGLGLRGVNDPSAPEYDYVVVLGGLVRACVARPAHAAKLLAGGQVRAAGVIALGGFRPLQGDEISLACDIIGSDITDEFDAMDAGVRKAFDLESSDRTEQAAQRSEVVGAGWAVTRYASATGVELAVMAAPSSEPGVRRANTADTYEWLATQSGWLHSGASVLLVTTDIYRPFQHADALRMLTLPHAVHVDVVGMVAGLENERLAQSFKPFQYLQEIRSTVRSMRALHEAASR